MTRTLSGLMLAVLLVSPANAQVTTGRLLGTVTDAQGGAIAGAKVEVVEETTGRSFDTLTNERGDWSVQSVSTGTYRVTVSLPGFKSSLVPNVKVDAAVPARVDVTLQIGGVTETVEVSAGAEILQTAVATITSTLTDRQINEMPFTSQRNALDLIVTQMGTSTPGTPRTSSINGLPKGSLNITLDGLNIQDNLLKSSDGFFANIQPKSDAVEEVTIATAGSGAESLGEGAAQVKFVTKSGTNNWHGGASWSVRNDYFNSNYYFNTIDHLKRDRIDLNQVGARLGGPIVRNKAFFFVSDEEFRLPQTYVPPLETVLTPDAINGIFTYEDSTGAIQRVNLYNLAAAKNPTLPASTRAYPTTPDPIVAGILANINTAVTSGQGTLTSRATASLNDYNRNNFVFQVPGQNKRRFFTTRLDYNVTEKHHLEFVYNFNYYNSNPDGVNGIYPIFPGSGTVLGHPASGGIWRETSSGVLALRSTLSANLTNELRAGISSVGNSLFRAEIVPGLFSQWNGYATSFNSFITNPYNSATQSRRNTPIRTVNDNLSLAQGSHLWNFGGTFTQINSWQSSQGTQLVPTVTFAIATGDPVNTGATSLFTAANFPNSTSANLSDAGALYALLTGRVSSFSRSVSTDENTHKYGNVPQVDRNRQREFGLYIQDSYRFRKSLTINYGVRWDVQFPFLNLNSTYSNLGGLAGLYGVSGVGNLFRPGVLTGSVPQFLPVTADQGTYKTRWKQYSPSLGLAYQLPKTGLKPLRWLTGQGDAVLRGAYSIATVREGMNVPISLWGSNQGPTFSTSITPSTFPNVFGAPGSVWFLDPVLPARAAPASPTYPIPVVAGNSVNDFDPNLRQAYVQSWTFSFQREIGHNTVLDVRYVGNHAVGLWRQYNLNEVNIFENGFLSEFQTAQANLALARQTNPNGTQFAGLAGQRPLPIITTALGLNSDTTTAIQLTQGQAGALANAIAFNATRMANLTNAGYPSNFFVVNPTVLGGGSFVVANGGGASYNSLQVELKKRLSSGFLAEGGYAWSKGLTNMDASSSSVFNQPSTLRNPRQDRGPSPWDIRHGFKLNAIYELPFGPGRRYLANLDSSVERRIFEGWELAAVTRIQSGSPAFLRSARQTFNASGGTGTGQSSTADAGVVLHGLTSSQLQNLMSIRKDPSGVVYYLPPDLLQNTYAAFEINGQSLSNLDPNKPYIGPPTTPGQLGQRVYLYGPWQQYWNLGVVKKTKIGEKKDIEFRASFQNAFNNANFLLGSAGNDVNTLSVAATGNPPFGQTRNAYKDFTVSGTNDPGGRVIEFTLRVNF